MIDYFLRAVASTNQNLSTMKPEMKKQWAQYWTDLRKHEERVEREKPFIQDFENEADFKKAFSEWQMMSSCDAPNKPGYYRANND